MADDNLTEDDYRRIVCKLRGQESDDERPARRAYDWGKPQKPPEPKPAPKPAPAMDLAALDDRMADFVTRSVGPAIDRLAECVNEALDDAHKAVEKISDRQREAEIAQGQASKRLEARLELLENRLELTAAKLEILELRTANDRKGATFDLPNPLMKTIN
jgi:hypothetical protein